MSDKVYDSIKMFLTRWLFPVMVILGGLGTMFTAMGYDISVYTTALVAFLGILGQAFQINIEKAKISYYSNEEKKNGEDI